MQNSCYSWAVFNLPGKIIIPENVRKYGGELVGKANHDTKIAPPTNGGCD